MLSARSWKNRSLPWHALIFWVWLVGFVFSAATSDLFHAPHCSQELLLQWAGHQVSASDQVSVSHPLSVGLDCASCAFHLAATAIFVVLATAFSAPTTAICFAIRRHRYYLRRFFSPIARGPPLRLNR